MHMEIKEIEKILEVHRSKRVSKTYATRADVRRILHACDIGMWEHVYKSALYRLHSAEYCSLLEVIYNAIEKYA